jgi:hypothetical protein
MERIDLTFSSQIKHSPKANKIIKHIMSSNNQPTMNIDSNNLALEGYCPVAYFFGPPKLGLENLTSTFQGATYRFVSEQAKSMFDADPVKYAPLYGGWCGTGMAHAALTPVDVHNYKIQDGRLILFYKDDKLDTKVMWEEDHGLKPKADENWKTGNYAASK